MLTLSTPGYADAFGKRSDAPYLRSLVRKGALLNHFESLGHGELADELAMVSGQAPNPDTGAGCTTFREYPSSAAADSKGLVAGKGCVYPDTALTLGDQVTSDGKVWGAYIDAMGKTTCQHPNSGASTGLALPGTEPGYDVLHNPFVFFHSLLDAGDCFNDDHDLGKLPSALTSASRTPRFSFVAPDACADGDPVAVQPPAGAGTTTGTTTSGTTTSGTGDRRDDHHRCDHHHLGHGHHDPGGLEHHTDRLGVRDCRHHDDDHHHDDHHDDHVAAAHPGGLPRRAVVGARGAGRLPQAAGCPRSCTRPPTAVTGCW